MTPPDGLTMLLRKLDKRGLKVTLQNEGIDAPWCAFIAGPTTDGLSDVSLGGGSTPLKALREAYQAFQTDA